MADASDIIDLTITVAAGGVTRAGFGTILIGGWHNRTTGDKTSTYNRTSDMVDDGFKATDLEYAAATKIKSQSPAPKQFKVGRLDSLANGPTQSCDVTPTTGVSTLYSLELAISGGSYQSIKFTSSATANTAEILASLTAGVAALNGYAGNIVAATASGKITIAGASAGKYFAPRSLNGNLSYKDTTPDPGVAASLASLLVEDPDWYALVLTYKSQNIVVAAAAAVEAMDPGKVYLAATQDTAVGQSGTTDVGAVLHASGYNRTVLLFNDDYMAQPDAALGGVWMPYDPGSETLMFKQLAGIAGTKLTASQLSQLKTTKKVNYYTTYFGKTIIANGVCASGRYADLTRFLDWLFVNVQEDLLAFFIKTSISPGKLPQTNKGYAAVEGIIRATLQRGVDAGGLKSGFVLEVPTEDDISQANVDARIVGPIRFSGDSAGAIHGASINGTIVI